MKTPMKLCVLTALFLGTSVHAADKTLIDYTCGSKIIVVPFDGAAVDRDLQNLSAGASRQDLRQAGAQAPVSRPAF